MAYDVGKDVCIHRESAIVEGTNEEIIVGIYSYNKGEPKVRANRKRMLTPKSTGIPEERYNNLGGMTVAELRAYIPLFKIAVGKIQDIANGKQVAPVQPPQPVAPPLAPQPQMNPMDLFTK